MTKAMFVTRGGEHYPPMGIMQISATAKQKGYETDLALLSEGNVLERIEYEKPDVVAYSGSTGEHKHYFEFNRELKKNHPEIKTILGGPHATFFPERSLKDGYFDAVCIGEGDEAFPEFLERIEKGKTFSSLENIMTDANKKPNLRPLIQDLDSLPFPDRELFYDHGSGESGQNSLKHFFVSRGCPYECSYCFNEQFKGMYLGEKYVRKRSVDSVLEELAQVKEKWPMDYVKFYDDIFSMRADDWLKEFSEKYSGEVGVPFFALERANLVTPEMVDLLADAGCHSISMSIESASPRIRKEVLNRNMTNEQIKAAYKLFGDKNIPIQSNNILGLPTSTIEDDIATIDFNIECGPKQGAVVLAEFGTAHPYPGTALERFCKENGFYDSNSGFKDMHMSYQTESPLNCFTPKEKRMQRNLTMLGPLAVRFPWTRNIMVTASKLPTNPLFFSAFGLNKSTGYMKHIYPMERSAGEYGKIILKSFKKNWGKRIKEI